MIPNFGFEKTIIWIETKPLPSSGFFAILVLINSFDFIVPARNTVGFYAYNHVCWIKPTYLERIRCP